MYLTSAARIDVFPSTQEQLVELQTHTFKEVNQTLFFTTRDSCSPPQVTVGEEGEGRGRMLLTHLFQVSIICVVALSTELVCENSSFSPFSF